ncbi:C40 family peptidase [Mesoterricola silvestris]|uniref:Peptidoglycan-binding protein n=1 Tax=Mesoterricola silvestris TaxID=2927979 RepID=A0AA48K9N7_9BACT|nr:NlpC/P60 family protein [Mesoterricola silvestris]BDU73265.1 peptidoglycan-binding protein [Mesoterricola silvestris]
MRNVLPTALAGLLLAGCSAPRPAPPKAAPPKAAPAKAPRAARLGFTIQAGAFAKVENASRLADLLQSRGLDAVYYAAQPGLYRVRFGDFPSREAARARAEALRAAGVIQEFYLVAPEEPPMARPAPREARGLRANLADTARSYLGVPYLWGGTTSRGFDCSGLAMAVYRLNGLQLPRNSREQFEAGARVAEPEVGDLVFFATGRRGEVSHVGIYVGDDVFIHAPGRGRRIARERLGDPYFRERYLGARTFLE